MLANLRCVDRCNNNSHREHTLYHNGYSTLWSATCVVGGGYTTSWSAKFAWRSRCLWIWCCLFRIVNAMRYVLFIRTALNPYHRLANSWEQRPVAQITSLYHVLVSATCICHMRITQHWVTGGKNHIMKQCSDTQRRSSHVRQRMEGIGTHAHGNTWHID